MGTSAKFLTCQGDGEQFEGYSKSAVEYLRGIADMELMNQEQCSSVDTFTVSYNDVKFSALSSEEAITNVLYAQMQIKFCGRVPFTPDQLRYKCLSQRLQFAWDTHDGLWTIKLLQVDHDSNKLEKKFTFEFKRVLCPF